MKNSPNVDGLALAVHRGESGAFERLVSCFEDALFTYAAAMLRNAFDAQEVVQDAFVRAHRALTRQYDAARCAELALRPWLFRTVRNLALNKQRRRRDEQPLDEDVRFASERDDVSLERRELLRAVIARLPDEARELIVLRFVDELSYAEMAKTLGASEAALRGKVFRALALLRKALERKGVTHAV